MAKDSELRKLIKRAKELGWEVSRTSKGHWKFTNPANGKSTFNSGSPSDWRATKNFVRQLRQIGWPREA